ncbi:MAG: methyltransferase domain-containing protein [Calditrichae bacterium]|nr:methyltransferase domain-containing protein [Calditrichia bacterium]NIW78255.1 methyltransferase domain-containing protein [Calditrichia bacterium]
MTVSQVDFDYIRQLVLERSAIVIDEGKEYLVESRVGPVAKDEGYGSIEELVSAIRNNNNNGLQNKVVEALTTNETSFFRDIHPFDMLKNYVIPNILKIRKNEKTINLWCAASSSGQEPYSVAMLIRENFPILLDWKLNFIASDISTEMLQKAKTGEFSQLEVNRGLSASLLIKYFEKSGTKWTIKKEIRDMIEFQKINLSEPLPYMPRMDIIFIRNVLIYFDIETKKQILKEIRKILQPEGYLFLGAAESTLNLDDSFQRMRKIQNSGCYCLKR